ncbi:Dabb family protein [Rhodoflexus sp.]
MKIRAIALFLLLIGMQIAFTSAAEKTIYPLLAQGKGSFVHIVYIWLKPEQTEEEIRQFEQAMRGLKKIKSIRKMHIGTPANTPRSVVDNSYTYALILYFDDVKGHDLYQEDPIHKDFVAKNNQRWERIQIYDIVLK